VEKKGSSEEGPGKATRPNFFRLVCLGVRCHVGRSPWVQWCDLQSIRSPCGACRSCPLARPYDRPCPQLVPCATGRAPRPCAVPWSWSWCGPVCRGVGPVAVVRAVCRGRGVAVVPSTWSRVRPWSRGVVPHVCGRDRAPPKGRPCRGAVVVWVVWVVWCGQTRPSMRPSTVGQ
jgi:hypothetical protein